MISDEIDIYDVDAGYATQNKFLIYKYIFSYVQLYARAVWLIFINIHIFVVHIFTPNILFIRFFGK